MFLMNMFMFFIDFLTMCVPNFCVQVPTILSTNSASLCDDAHGLHIHRVFSVKLVHAKIFANCCAKVTTACSGKLVGVVVILSNLSAIYL